MSRIRRAVEPKNDDGVSANREGRHSCMTNAVVGQHDRQRLHGACRVTSDQGDVGETMLLFPLETSCHDSALAPTPLFLFETY